VVEPVVVEPAYTGPTHAVASFAGVAVKRGEVDLPIIAFAGPGGQVEIRVETPRAEAPHVPDPDELPPDPPLDDDVPPAEPGDASPSEHDAEDPDPPVEDSDEALADAASPSLIQPAALVWGTLTFLSVGLAIFALVITVLALSGLDRVF
jgi:hypothetical protein